MAIDIFAQRQWNAGFGFGPFFRLQQVAHDDLGLHRVGNFHANRAFTGDRREDVDAFGFKGSGDVVAERGDFFEANAGSRVQFVARDGWALGDVAQRHFDVELRERALHEPRVGHQLLFRLRWPHGLIRQVQEVHRRKLIIANSRSRCDGDWLFASRLFDSPAAVVINCDRVGDWSAIRPVSRRNNWFGGRAGLRPGRSGPQGAA